MPRPKDGYKNQADQPIPGVHDITGRYADKEALIGWAYNQGKAGLPRFQRAALDIGTTVHRMAELDLRGKKREIETVPYELLQAPADIDKAFQAFQQFLDWRKEHCVRAIAFEESLISEIHQYGGTLDIIALVDGARGLLDFKTSKTAGQIYLEQKLVMAAHGNLWRENHPDLPLSGYHLITLPKDGSRFGHHAFADLSPEWEMFCLQLDCWRIEKGLAMKRRVPVTPEQKAALSELVGCVESIAASNAPKAPPAESVAVKQKRKYIRKPKPDTPAAEAPRLAPPVAAALTMAELLRAYGHVKEAA